MLDRRRRLRFVEEALHDLAVARQLGVENLDRCVLADQRVLGLVDRPHSADRELAHDLEITDGLPDHCARSSRVQTHLSNRSTAADRAAYVYDNALLTERSREGR